VKAAGSGDAAAGYAAYYSGRKLAHLDTAFLTKLLYFVGYQQQASPRPLIYAAIRRRVLWHCRSLLPPFLWCPALSAPGYDDGLIQLVSLGGSCFITIEFRRCQLVEYSSMMTSMPAENARQGLLDLSVDLSAPIVYAGSDFTLYLHIKNPFGFRVWIHSVELSLPAQLSWKPAVSDPRPRRQGAHMRAIEKQIIERHRQISDLQAKLRSLPRDDQEQHDKLLATIAELTGANVQDEEFLARLRSASVVSSSDGTINVQGVEGKGVYISGRNSTINVVNSWTGAEAERVPLLGSLPRDVALEPGCTDVWTIRLGSSRSPFLIPAIFRLQLTVIYSPVGPRKPRPLISVLPASSQEDDSAEHEQIFANTTSMNVSLKAALRSVILGGTLGGLFGSLARSLQVAKTLSVLAHHNLGTSIGALLLAVILSGAAIIFSARKTDAQSFVTVEDFWGGILVGFLIGYSGTAAFASITGIHG
jgi:hypothetical protein